MNSQPLSTQPGSALKMLIVIKMLFLTSNNYLHLIPQTNLDGLTKLSVKYNAKTIGLLKKHSSPHGSTALTSTPSSQSMPTSPENPKTGTQQPNDGWMSARALMNSQPLSIQPELALKMLIDIKMLFLTSNTY